MLNIIKKVNPLCLLVCWIMSCSLLIAAESNKKYYLKDHIGSTRVVVDQGGAVTETYDYYPFGLQMPERIMTSGASTKNLFTGKEHDDETGWDYFGARYYSAALGRWMVVDPLAEDYAGISPYSYALNNPLVFTDPDGARIEFAPGVSDKFKAAFAEAVQHLDKHGAGGMIDELRSREEVVFVDEIRGVSSFDPNDNTIRWSPNQAMQTLEGHTISATTLLNHEVDHALQFLKNPEQLTTDINIDIKGYDNAEEKRVITGSEQTTALKLDEIKQGEVTRKNHVGKLVDTSGPTKSVSIKTEKALERERKIQEKERKLREWEKELEELERKRRKGNRSGNERNKD
ncbi:MAG: RHS repeat domain-containing protein [Calditrichia bacterium]